ncbi:hypothetical protein GC105_10720 [Alkalibaculum sp. M08DMB]|uniref:Uncharacterized protein n=1 Tax=Alkalibaculum sporogenes TaxID=2655001 RepID=A0A6A7K9W6_9FIRM|nr:hypothetical protein [Alkalibaculum sporogenes]MPW26260.1 hypothetical protein [Alkalibaculum sporogenes]
MKLGLNYKNVLEMNITPKEASPTWARVGEGFANVTEALNEVLYQASYLNNAGWGSTEVTGGQYIATLTGVRAYGDLAQDYIFSHAVMFAFGEARKTTFRVTRDNQTVLEWDVTLANITDGGGDSQQPSAITVAIHGNGEPRVLTDALLGSLTVVSVAGAIAGDTAIYVNPVKGASNSYKYKSAPGVALPLFDEVLTTGWTEWNGADEITSTTGYQIVIVEVETSTNKAKKAGIATITTA